MLVFENITDERHKPHTAVRNIRIEVDPNADIVEITKAFGDFLKASGFPESVIEEVIDLE